MKQRLIIGSGQYNYDVIRQREYPEGFVPGKRNAYTEKNILEEAGGTCGNVMCMLRHLGWTAQPQVKLIDNEEGKALADSLSRYGCDNRYVSFDDKGSYFGLVCTHRRNRLTGEHEIGRRVIGANGSSFGKRTELRVKGEVDQFLASVETAPDVYFFDSMEAGPRAIASGLRQRGSLIYFEAESCKEMGKFQKSAEVADIVKFSNENVPDPSVCNGFNDKLCIQTMGDKGLQFKLRDGGWNIVPPTSVDNVVDWEGCGDTTTAVLISELGNMGLPPIAELTEEQVMGALTQAMKKAAECTQYVGSKGWIKADKR